MGGRSKELVIARKLKTGGEVRVHTFRRYRYQENTHQVTGGTMTDCGLVPDWDLRSWLWAELRTLNPEKVVRCRRCLPYS